jgi:hypothetical protein
MLSVTDNHRPLQGSRRGVSFSDYGMVVEDEQVFENRSKALKKKDIGMRIGLASL